MHKYFVLLYIRPKFINPFQLFSLRTNRQTLDSSLDFGPINNTHCRATEDYEEKPDFYSITELSNTHASATSRLLNDLSINQFSSMLHHYCTFQIEHSQDVYIALVKQTNVVYTVNFIYSRYVHHY